MTQTALYLATIVIGQLTSLLLLPVVTKFLGPTQFGQYSVALATTGLIGTFGSAWVRNVAMRLYFDYVPTGRTRAFFWSAALLQILMVLGCLSIGALILGGRDEAMPLVTYAWAGVGVLVGDFYSLSLNMLMAGRRSVAFSVAEVTSSLLRLGMTWIGLLAGLRTPTMLFVFTSASLLLASLVATPSLGRILSGPMAIERSVMREIVRLGIPSIPVSVGAWVTASSDRTLLAYFLGVRAAGVYSVAYTVADRAVGALASALFMTAWPAILSTWPTRRDEAPGTISRYLGIYVLFTTGPSVLLILRREFVLTLLTTTEYASASNVVPWVVTGVWLSGAATYFNRPLELTKRYGSLSAITMAAAGVNLALNLLLIPTVGIIGAAASTALAFASMALMSRIAGGHEFHVPIPWPALLLAGGATFAATLTSGLFASPYASIAVFVSVYCGTLVVSLAAWRPFPRAGTID